jgi:hypothetical protein
MRWLGRWLANSLVLALALTGALALMQAPAVTRKYAAALRQVARELQRDIDQRTASARQFYAIAAEDDERFLLALRAVEPSNAQTLAASLERVHRLEAAHDRIAGAAPMLQPLLASWDAARNEHDDLGIVRRTLLETYTPQLSLSAVAVAYGFAGLVAGTLLAQAVRSLSASAVRRFSRRSSRRLAR